MLNKLGILSACSMALAIVSMLGATIAQAEENKGPLWIVGSPAKGLKSGETRAVSSRTEAAPILRGKLSSVECEKATSVGVLLGGSPGTAYAKTTAEDCHLLGKRNCVMTGLRPLTTNAGEIITDTLTILAFAKGSRTSASPSLPPRAKPAMKIYSRNSNSKPKLGPPKKYVALLKMLT